MCFEFPVYITPLLLAISNALNRYIYSYMYEGIIGISPYAQICPKCLKMDRLSRTLAGSSCKLMLLLGNTETMGLCYAF